jgi:hypothetical protein
MIDKYYVAQSVFPLLVNGRQLVATPQQLRYATKSGDLA